MFVPKSSVHFTTGRRFALPHEDASGTIPAGVLPKNQTLLGGGLQPRVADIHSAPPQRPPRASC